MLATYIRSKLRFDFQRHGLSAAHAHFCSFRAWRHTSCSNVASVSHSLMVIDLRGNVPDTSDRWRVKQREPAHRGSYESA